ncbi:FadR/GntR family transcriptional regulator [Paracoccus aestuariivivens]|uniref:FCD domain-containing protein n=1 Tax=Paracoccus aestuariivivens TaxID=1820333 RepID=A0A6L6JDF6_9RHOB|nr:FadR/GntR family transcriptional regulator [Paracoccus aestuariivivens]MTH79556.1 FCD domain-containing protein [Paracoccus aestuariivivens]
MELDLTTRKPRLSEKVVKQLKAEILSGGLHLGAQLPTEPGLMERFGVSRTVVREAIAALRNDGLVSSTQGRGMFVTDVLPGASIWRPPEEVDSIPRSIDLYEFRQAWEPEAAALAAVRRSATQDYAIRSAHERVCRAVQANQFPLNGNYDFHLAVARATGNMVFEEAIVRFGPHLKTGTDYPNLSQDQAANYFRTVILEHARIVDAISARDAIAAREAMMAHLVRSFASYREEVALAPATTISPPGISL